MRKFVGEGSLDVQVELFEVGCGGVGEFAHPHLFVLGVGLAQEVDSRAFLDGLVILVEEVALEGKGQSIQHCSFLSWHQNIPSDFAKPTQDCFLGEHSTCIMKVEVQFEGVQVVRVMEAYFYILHLFLILLVLLYNSHIQYYTHGWLLLFYSFIFIFTSKL